MRGRSGRRLILLIQSVLIVGILGITVAIAIDFARSSVLGQSTSIAIVDRAEDLAAALARGDETLPAHLAFLARTDADGRILESVGEPTFPVPNSRVAGLSADAPAGVDVGGGIAHAVPLADGGWLVGQLSPAWVDARVLPMLLPISLLCLGAGALCYGAAKAASGVVRRRLYPLEPEDISALTAEHETLLNTMHDAAVAVGGDGRLTVVNDAAIQLLDLRPTDVGRAAAEVLPPSLLRVLDGRAETDGFAVVQDKALMVHANEQMAHLGGTSRLLVLRDHSELVRLLGELDGAEHANSGLRAERHEFDNTLHILAGLLEMGRVDLALDFIRSGEQHALPDPEPSPVGDAVLLALIQAYRAQAREFGVRLAVHPDSRVPELTGLGESPSLFARDTATILGNLLANAVEATGVGGRIDASLGWFRDDRRIRLRLDVRDSGPGVAPELRERIFEEGFSTKTGVAGHGLGLSIVRRIVARHEGVLRLHEADAAPGPASGAWISVELTVPASEERRFVE